jgi:hypothetical protein
MSSELSPGWLSRRAWHRRSGGWLACCVASRARVARRSSRACLWLFDQAVGEEDEGGAAGELIVQVSAGSAGVDAEGRPRGTGPAPRAL